MEAQQHKHRHEDRRQNRPDGRAAGDKHTQKSRQQRQTDKRRDAVHAGALQQVRQANGHKPTHIAPVEHRHELRQREDHHDKSGHLFHRLNHQLRQIGLAANFAGGDAVSQRHDKEEKDDQRHDAFDKRRGHDCVLNRVAKNAVFGDHHQGDDRHERQRRHAGDAQAETLLGGQGLQLVITTALPLAQPRLHQLVSDQTADEGQEDHRGRHKVPVVDHADVQRGIDGFGRFGADPGEQHVGGDDQ